MGDRGNLHVLEPQPLNNAMNPETKPKIDPELIEATREMLDDPTADYTDFDQLMLDYGFDGDPTELLDCCL